MAELIKVYNDRNYDYGVVTLQGMEKNIKPGSFITLTEDDIQYIESQCAHNRKPFANGELRAVMPHKEKTLSDIGIEPSQDNLRLPKVEIIELLKGKTPALKAWLETIDATEYLHEIFEIAKEIDLPTSKVRMLKEKLPNKMFVDDDE